MGNEIEKLQSVLQSDPSNFQARRELSILLADNGFNEEALSNLQYLVKYFPEDAELQYNIGILYEKLKNFEKAKKAYQNAIKISPQADFYYNLGEVLVTLKEWDDAIESFKTVLKTDSKDGNCYFNLGLCYYNKDEINLATDNFQQAVTLNPQDIFAHFYLGYIYQSKGLTNFAIESYKKVLAISPDYSWAYYNLAAIAFKNDNLEEAKDYLLKTIECNDSDIEAYKLLTKIYLREHEAEEIISILETRLDKDDNGDLYYILAQAYKHIGKTEDYAENLESALNNSLTLTYPQDIVRKEYSQTKHNKNLKVEEFEDYSTPDSNDEYSENDNEFESDNDNEEDFSEDESEDEYSDEAEDDNDFEEDENEFSENEENEDDEYEDNEEFEEDIDENTEESDEIE